MPRRFLLKRQATAASLILAPGSLALEFLAIAPLLDEAAGSALLLRFFLFHALACIGFALMAYPYMPERYRQQQGPLLLLLFVLPFFMPIIGGAGLVAGMLIALFLPERTHAQTFSTLKAAEFAQPKGRREGGFGHGAIRPLLSNPSVPPERRLKALLSLESVPASTASEILRQVLHDSDEDIRLIAYGILDKREKSIQRGIAGANRKLRQARDDKERLSALRRLAQLQWELIYGDLTLGDVRVHMVLGTQRLLDEALKLAPHDPGLWFMKGRLAVEMGSDEQAREAFQHALELGLPRGRALPYLAELAFHERRFDAVRRYMVELSSIPMAAGLRPTVSYWSTGVVTE